MDLAKVQTAKDNAIQALFDRQDKAEGWWKGELETNVSIEATDLFMREFLYINTPEITAKTANWIRSQRGDDGTWANFYQGIPELSTTTEAYIALRLAGDSPDSKEMRTTREFILDSGGLEYTRVFTRIWMAFFGEWDYKNLPTLAPEMMYLPRWFPFNIYNFACWARQAIVPLLILGTMRPVRPVLKFNLDELKTGKTPPERQNKNFFSNEGVLLGLDKLAGQMTKFSPKFIRNPAIKKAERWILDRQEEDGCWGGIQPPLLYSILALSTLKYETDHPVIKKAIDHIDSFTVQEGDTRRLECCQSPIWDTALSIVALVDAGVPPDDENLTKAGEWLLTKEVRVKGDWSVRRPKLEPGGWAFEFNNVNYPDVDDTAEVALALDRLTDEKIQERASAAIKRGINWIEGMQCKPGGYAAFDVDNNTTILHALPFCDFGSVVDPPTEDVTAHVIEMFVRLQENPEYEINQARMEKALNWLFEQQRSDGSWFGRWGCNYIYGAGAVLPALRDVGVPSDDKRIQATVEWLRKIQNPDGGWGEDVRSYDDPKWAGKGATTPSQTAWAVMALLAASEIPLATEGIKWLIDNQRADGTWDEPYFTGTGFPGDFYINYHLYRDIFPLTALGRYISYTS